MALMEAEAGPDRSPALRRMAPTVALLLPALVLLVLLYLLPLAEIVRLSFGEAGASLDAYGTLARDEIARVILSRTVWIAVQVTAICLVAGFPVASLIARASPRIAPVLLLLVVIPMWTSILVRSYAWMVLLGREGVVNGTLVSLGLAEAPLQLLYNRFAVIVGMVHVMLPFMILPILNTLRQIPPALPAAAESLGASPLRAFLTVVLPLSLPGVAAGCALVFILSLGFYVTPALLGGLRDTTFVLLIERYVTAIRDWPMAAAMSVLLLVLTLGAVAAGQLGAAGRAQGGHRPARPSGPVRLMVAAVLAAATRARRGGGERRAGRSQARPKAATVLLGGAGLVFLCAPLLIILILSFSDAPFLTFPPEGLSLRWYENFFSRPDWTDAALTSVRVALATMVLATFVGTLAAVALVRADFPGKALLAGFMISPIVVPTMVLAIALYFVFARLGIVGTEAGLILAHTVLGIPFVIVVVSGALRSTDILPERAARTLGAPPPVAFLRVTLPVLRPAVLTAAFFAFLASFDELVIALFIAGTGARTLPKRMWEGIREEIDPTIAAVAAMLIGLTLLLLMVSEVAKRRRS